MVLSSMAGVANSSGLEQSFIHIRKQSDGGYEHERVVIKGIDDEFVNIVEKAPVEKPTARKVTLSESAIARDGHFHDKFKDRVDTVNKKKKNKTNNNQMKKKKNQVKKNTLTIGAIGEHPDRSVENKTDGEITTNKMQ